MLNSCLSVSHCQIIAHVSCNVTIGESSRRQQGAPTRSACAGNSSYQLALVQQTPIDEDQPLFSFVCSSSSSGSGKAGGAGFDRVCALRGRGAHIFTIFRKPEGQGDAPDTGGERSRATHGILLMGEDGKYGSPRQRCCSFTANAVRIKHRALRYSLL